MNNKDYYMTENHRIHEYFTNWIHDVLGIKKTPKITFATLCSPQLATHVEEGQDSGFQIYLQRKCCIFGSVRRSRNANLLSMIIHLLSSSLSRNLNWNALSAISWLSFNSPNQTFPEEHVIPIKHFKTLPIWLPKLNWEVARIFFWTLPKS